MATTKKAAAKAPQRRKEIRKEEQIRLRVTAEQKASTTKTRRGGRRLKLSLSPYQVLLVGKAAQLLARNEPAERDRHAWSAVLREAQKALAYYDERFASSRVTEV